MRELEPENELLKSPDLTLEAGASRFWGMPRNLPMREAACAEHVAR